MSRRVTRCVAHPTGGTVSALPAASAVSEFPGPR
jgi:hypothetical protein